MRSMLVKILTSAFVEKLAFLKVLLTRERPRLNSGGFCKTHCPQHGDLRGKLLIVSVGGIKWETPNGNKLSPKDQSFKILHSPAEYQHLQILYQIAFLCLLLPQFSFVVLTPGKGRTMPNGYGDFLLNLL